MELIDSEWRYNPDTNQIVGPTQDPEHPYDNRLVCTLAGVVVDKTASADEVEIGEHIVALHNLYLVSAEMAPMSDQEFLEFIAKLRTDGDKEVADALETWGRGEGDLVFTGFSIGHKNE